MEFVVVGCRGFGRYHLNALSKIDVDVSIVERDRDAVKFCENNFEISKVYSDLDEALNSGAEVIDLVVPHHLHAPMVNKSLMAGKHVLVEKPIATSMQDARSMVRTSEESGKKFMVAEQYFFDPAIARIRDYIYRDEIGKVHTIIFRSQRLLRGSGWRREPESNGGGALIDGGIHFVDAILNVGGEYDGVIGRSYRGDPTRESEDSTMALFDFKSGAKGFLYYSWAHSAVVNVPSYEIIGDNGAIVEDMGTRPNSRFEAMRGYRAFGDPVINNRIIQTGEYDVFYAEIQGFLDSINQDTEVPFSPELAIRDLKAVLRIYGNNSL